MGASKSFLAHIQGSLVTVKRSLVLSNCLMNSAKVVQRASQRRVLRTQALCLCNQSSLVAPRSLPVMRKFLVNGAKIAQCGGCEKVVSAKSMLADLEGSLIERKGTLRISKLASRITNGTKAACNSGAIWAHGDLEDLECPFMTRSSVFKRPKFLMRTAES